MALALKARAPSGAAGSNPRSLRHDVHVRQIRLAAAVRKTATLRGDGGSNPLACTKLVLYLLHLGRQSVLSRNLHTARSRAFGSCTERLRRLMIGRLPVEEYGASLTLVVAANFAGVR